MEKKERLLNFKILKYVAIFFMLIVIASTLSGCNKSNNLPTIDNRILGTLKLNPISENNKIVKEESIGTSIDLFDDSKLNINFEVRNTSNIDGWFRFKLVAVEPINNDATSMFDTYFDEAFEHKDDNYYYIGKIKAGEVYEKGVNINLPSSENMMYIWSRYSIRLVVEAVKKYNNAENSIVNGMDAEWLPNPIEDFKVIATDNNTCRLVNYIGDNSDKNYTDNGVNIIIPNEVDGMQITEIADSVFSNDHLNSVILPENLITIGNKAFYSNYIGEIIIPESVTNIGEEAFTHNMIRNLILPNNITFIGDGAFGCNGISTVTIPESLTNIGGAVFHFNGLTNITIPEGVTSIGNSAFAYNRITNVTIPESVEIIEKGAFYRNNLTTITIPSNVTSIENAAFADNDLINVLIEGDETRFDGFWEDIGFPSDLGPGTTTYNGYYFNKGNAEILEYLGSETDIVIPEEIEGIKVRNIGASAFSGSGLRSVVIPEGVTRIGNSAFAYNILESVTLPSTLEIIDNKAFIQNNITSVIIPSKVKTMGEYAFAWNKITTLTISEGVTSIGDYSFWYNEITSLIIPGSLKTVSWCSFDSNKLTHLTISEGVERIEGNAFEENSLTSITIPESVTFIEYGAFYDNNLKKIIIKGDKDRFNDSWNDIGFPWYLKLFN